MKHKNQNDIQHILGGKNLLWRSRCRRARAPGRARWWNTTYVQQQNDLYKKHGRIVDPRLQIVKDLQPILINLIQKGHKVIVNADINDEAGREYSHQWNKMMEETGMRNIIQNKHQNRALPRTYDRGKRCLDIIAVSENIQNNEIRSCGILPFYSVSASDHRPLYVDFKASTLFDETTPDTTNQTYRRFTTKNTYKCGKYIQHLSHIQYISYKQYILYIQYNSTCST